eukprot:Gb_17271 [translate_table: standard]
MENKDLKVDRAVENVASSEEKLIAGKSDEKPDFHENAEETKTNVQNESTEVQESKAHKEDGTVRNQTLNIGQILAEEKEDEPVFDGTENPEMNENGRSSESYLGVEGSAWPEKATVLKNYVLERGLVVSNAFRRLSGKKEENIQSSTDIDNKVVNKEVKNCKDEDHNKDNKVEKGFKDWSVWNPLNLIKTSSEPNAETKTDQSQGVPQPVDLVPEPVCKGRIILFSTSGSPECRLARSFLRRKGIKFVEINIDIYPSRKQELVKRTGTSSVPKIFFNDLCISGVSVLKAMEEAGELDDKVRDLMENEAPSSAPLLPSAGEDDFANDGSVDEFVNVVRKLREAVVIKDRFYKMRMFSKCFLGSEAIDFLVEDQLLLKDEAIEFGKKLAAKHFFHHVLDENDFEDGNHLYRFLEDDPVVSTKCYNFTRCTNDMKPKPANEIASRLRSLTLAIYEAYISEDGNHVDYKSIGHSEEFARYLKTIEELHRIELHDFSREENLAFFINLYNMMAIHAIVLCGHPNGALERRKYFGDFKYVIGGYPYSLSAIQNGILRANQRPPYNLIRPFGLKDKRSRVALPDAEPLVHFASVCGSKSSPALRCYSPERIDEELRLSARFFFEDGAFSIDAETKTASLSKILKWYSVDFGKNETEVLKFVANYLEPSKSQQLLGFLGSNQLKIAYQPYDWALNC